MLISLNKIISDFNLKINGVLHIGAHHGEEYDSYKEAGIKNLIFFEPIKLNYQQLVNRLPTTTCYNIALGNEVGMKEMFVENTNDGQSCSLLEPKNHLVQYPNIIFDKRETVIIDKLDNISFDRYMFNMINIDVQGFELEVFKGAIETLKAIEIIYTEVSREELYKNCAQINEIDSFLKNFNFTRVITDWSGISWGDALYLKYDNI